VYSVCVCVCVRAYTHSISTEGRDVVIVGRVSKLDSVLTGFGLTAQGAFSIRDINSFITVSSISSEDRLNTSTNQNKLRRSNAKIQGSKERGKRKEGKGKHLSGRCPKPGQQEAGTKECHETAGVFGGARRGRGAAEERQEGLPQGAEAAAVR